MKRAFALVSGPWRLALAGAMALALITLCAAGADAGAAPVWQADLTAALDAGKGDGKPALVLVRRPGGVAGMDARYWLEERDLAPLLRRFHAVLLPQTKRETVAEFLPGREASDPWDHESRFASGSRLLFLTAARKLITIAPIPETRVELKALLETVLADARPLEELAAAAKANPLDAQHAVDALRESGRIEQALALARGAQAASEEGPIRKRWGGLVDDLAIAARYALLARIARAAGSLEGLAKNPPAGSTRPAALTSLLPALEDAAAGMTGAFPEAVARGCKLLSEAAASTDEAAAKLAGELAPLVKARAGELRKQALEAQKAYAAAHPDEVRAQLWRLRYALDNENDTRAGSEPEARRLLRELLARPMPREECLAAAGTLAEVTLRLDLSPERLQLEAKLQREAPVGRATAIALLDLADEALAQGSPKEADACWRAALAAADRGESPTLAHTARVARSVALGEGTPERSPWARRKVLDVVVLVQDLESFAAAVARWSDREFFPVLFADDLYAPRFVAAFRPSRVILVPPCSGAVSSLAPEVLRGAVLASWSTSDREERRSATATPEQLRARLRSLRAAPPGVVFTDGTSGETAGGLALAAGRFEGFEILPVPQVGSGDAARPAAVNDHLSQDAAGEMSRQVRDALGRWAPPMDGWPGVTLAGAYPYRYAGEAFGPWGQTYALDDLLGRDEDGRRVAVSGRLLGDPARSAYQAACSLFLRADRAYLFNTYGTNPASIWGYYRMDTCEAWLAGRMAVTHDRNQDATVEGFRTRVFPWNPYPLMAINSSGWAYAWSVGGGGGTPDDFPVGVPSVIHITHSGSAGDLYNSDTLAGRALWGGTFWYFGSTAEPFLSAFQPPRYYGPRLAAGATLAAAFRERPGQEFWRPWRLIVVGDPLFSLRAAPAARVPYPAARGPVVVPGETLLAGSVGGGTAQAAAGSYGGWLEALRRARWSGDRAAARSLLGAIAAGQALDGPGLAMALEEDLMAGQAAPAAERWSGATEAARQHYAARIYARQAIGSVMDRALTAKDLPELRRLLPQLLSTAPAANFVERWLGKLAALAKEKGEVAAVAEWLRTLAVDPLWRAYAAQIAAAAKGLVP